MDDKGKAFADQVAHKLRQEIAEEAAEIFYKVTSLTVDVVSAIIVALLFAHLLFYKRRPYNGDSDDAIRRPGSHYHSPPRGCIPYTMVPLGVCVPKVVSHKPKLHPRPKQQEEVVHTTEPPVKVGDPSLEILVEKNSLYTPRKKRSNLIIQMSSDLQASSMSS
ncbi:unnamed protein product [Calicophoron daubneyi]|uniref:Uncharacterized protein n=1 Tax=Calicophoron daubneyi TaxID=300641 RepID=A0AAV2TTI0_CALDB